VEIPAREASAPAPTSALSRPSPPFQTQAPVFNYVNGPYFLPCRRSCAPQALEARRTRILHTAQYNYASSFLTPYKMGFTSRLSVFTGNITIVSKPKFKFSSTCRPDTRTFQVPRADTVAAVPGQTTATDATSVEVEVGEEAAARPHLSAYLQRPT
jgi:hypothetical protein